MPHFTKPPEGSWTEHFGLDTGPVSYEDSISPARFELECEAIFRRTWLNVGRVEQLPRKGSYFTKQLDAARTSVVVVRDSQGEVRAFHNICRHRGNKLVWSDFPKEETSGICRQFTCKYHGWRYSLDGDLTFVQQEEEFFDLEKSDYGLVGVRTEVWAGFIFVNLDSSDPTPLREYMGVLGAGIEDYPFHLMTQVHRYRAEVGSNWKLFIDAFTEFYHAPVLHAKQSVSDESAEAAGGRVRGTRLRGRRTSRDGVVLGRNVPAQGPQHGETDREGSSKRSIRSLGSAGHRDRRAATGTQSRPSSDLGSRLLPVLPELHAARLEAELVSDVPLLADLLQHSRFRGHRVLRASPQCP